MTYEEALETISVDQVKEMLEMVKTKEKYHFLIPLFEKQIEFYQIASEAISLQIAKKPINMESVPYSSDDDWITYGICLNCGHIVDTKEDKERCLSCGQKLLWE